MITIEKALELFLMDQQLKGNSENTIENYRSVISRFINYIGLNRNIETLELIEVKRYQLYLQEKEAEFHFNSHIHRSLSKKTVQTYIRQIRVFLNWAYAEAYINQDIGSKLKLPKAPKQAIEILSDEEIEILYRAINERTEYGLRNKCIISLMLDSGLRRDEAITLEIPNIHFTQNIIKVTGKGDKERIIPLGVYTKKLLFKYLNGYRPMPIYPTNRVFLTQDKTPLTSDVIKMLFTRLKKKTGIQRLKPHLLRHTFATRYLINGGDAFSLQMILGHTSLDMTRAYSHLASAYTVKNFHKLSTLDLLKGRNVKL